jgi:uroporphyrinogen decarboxylase
MQQEHLSPRQRLENLISGNVTDRLAASIWRHFFNKETTVEGLVSAMIDFQNEFQWDFMKINPRASFHVEDWGCKLEWSTDEFTKHVKTEFAVKDISDWDKIEVLSPAMPVLNDHLKAIEKIRKETGPYLPLFMTVFNPLGIARYLVGSTGKLLDHLDKNEAIVTGALERITETFENFAAECRKAGADGLFYATLEWASSETIPYETYHKLCRPLDIRIIRAAGNDALNILHVCHNNNYLKKLADYPVDLINWDSAHPTNINPDDALEMIPDKVLIAGLDDKGWLWHSNPDEVANEIRRLKEKYFGKKVILGPGCAVEPRIPYKNFTAVKANL